MYGDETVPFPETLNYTLNLAYQENREMLGEHTLSPQPRACTVNAYYSYALSIQSYQNMLFLHVYIQLWPLRKNSSLEKPPRTYAHVIDINIPHARAGERRRQGSIVKRFTSLVPGDYTGFETPCGQINQA